MLTDEERLGVRLPTALLDQLRERAAREHRTVSGELRRALTIHLRDGERTDGQQRLAA